jgi:hypothetical protein
MAIKRCSISRFNEHPKSFMPLGQVCVSKITVYEKKLYDLAHNTAAYLVTLSAGQQRLPELSRGPPTAKVKRRVPMDDVSARLGVDIGTARPVLLQQTSSQMPAVRCAFPSQAAGSTSM